jgi:hypothetical protein
VIALHRREVGGLPGRKVVEDRQSPDVHRGPGALTNRDWRGSVLSSACTEGFTAHRRY